MYIKHHNLLTKSKYICSTNYIFSHYFCNVQHLVIKMQLWFILQIKIWKERSYKSKRKQTKKEQKRNQKNRVYTIALLLQSKMVYFRSKISNKTKAFITQSKRCFDKTKSSWKNIISFYYFQNLILDVAYAVPVFA